MAYNEPAYNERTYNISKKKKLLVLLNEMQNVRTGIEDLLCDLATYVLPDRLRMFVTDANEYSKRREAILDATASRASRTLQSGFSSGITNVSLNWFRLGPPHPAMSNIPGVRAWLHGSTEAMRFVLSNSNFYQVSPMVYEDMGTFATGACLVERDMDTIIHYTHLPIGSYWIASDWKGRTNMFAREYTLTVLDVIEKFALRDDNTIDWSKLSESVESHYKNNRLNYPIEVTHMITPNEDYDPEMEGQEYKKFQSCYWESGTGNVRAAMATNSDYDDDRYLRESGFDYFPVLAPKWSVLGEDWWGSNCPGMTALPDIKMLQKMHSRKFLGLDKMVDPPTSGPTKLRKMPASTMPGRKTWVDVPQGSNKFEPIYQVNPRVLEIRTDIAEVRQAISDYYFESVFLAMTRDQRNDRPTATEVREISAEKTMLIGPVLERVNVDFLNPNTDIVFYEMNELGMIPPPPPELQGMPLKVEYISALAQQQKLVSIGAIDRFMGFIAGYAGINPMIVHKINGERIVDEYASILGITPGSIRTEKEFNAIIQQIQQQQQMAAQAEQAKMMGQATKQMSQSEMSDGESVLDKLAGG